MTSRVKCAVCNARKSGHSKGRFDKAGHWICGVCYKLSPQKRSYEKDKNLRPEFQRLRRNAAMIEWRKRVKLEVMIHYSGGVPCCACCGEDIMDFLSIDHIHGNGNLHRKTNKIAGGYIYAWLKMSGFPEGFRVLCMNCNHAIGRLGYCPHDCIIDGK